MNKFYKALRAELRKCDSYQGLSSTMAKAQDTLNIGYIEVEHYLKLAELADVIFYELLEDDDCE